MTAGTWTARARLYTRVLKAKYGSDFGKLAVIPDAADDRPQGPPRCRTSAAVQELAAVCYQIAAQNVSFV